MGKVTQAVRVFFNCKTYVICDQRADLQFLLLVFTFCAMSKLCLIYVGTVSVSAVTIWEEFHCGS